MAHVQLGNRQSPTGNPRGMALVIVLAIIVLVLGLCVGFLARVSTERSSSKGYASTVEAKLLADSAVQVVQGQIDAATTQGTKVAWSSQPGLVRTYDDTGSPAKSYKLYSSDTMQIAGALDPASEKTALAEWFNNPALYTDINAPVASRFSGTADTWPILDPSSLKTGSTTTPPQGFSITGAPTGAYQGVTNDAPMPVRWLYVLKDGQIVAPTGTGNTANVPGADKSPIVGRIAFWTDDETCKVNVNTASEGTYWDVPKGTSPAEKNLGMFQPATNEFQSYPGHPGSTSLSPVFPDLTREQIFGLVPRLADGGSKNATLAVNKAKTVPLDQDRLYATGDEIIFANDRTGNPGIGKELAERGKFFLTAVSRAPETNLFNLPKVVCWPIPATNSTDYRTPFDRLFAFCGELNGNPYFFQRKNPDSTTEDYTGIPRNKTVLKYLQTLTDRPVPGFGGNLASKYQTDKDQILTEIFDYIRCTNLSDGKLAADKRYASGKELNGVGKGRLGYGQVLPIEIADFSTRGFGRVPIITEVGLWVICTADAKVPTPVPSNDPVTNATLYPADASGKLTFNDTLKTKQMRVEAALVFEPFVPLAGYKDLTPDIEVKISGLENWTLRGNAAGDTDKNLRFPSLLEQDYNIKGRYSMSRSMTSTHGSVAPRAGHVGIWAALGERGIRARNNGRLGQDPAFSQTDSGSGSILNQQYPFVGEPVTMNVDASSSSSARLILNAGQIELTVVHRPTGTILQTYKLDFPGTTQLPAPVLGYKTSGTTPGWTFQGSVSGFPTGSEGRFKDLGLYPLTADGYTDDGKNNTSKPGDVVRSIVPAYDKGGAKQSADFRLLAMKSQISVSDFSKHPLFDLPGWRVADAFVQQPTGWYYHLTHGRLLSSLTTALGGDVTNLSKATGSYYDASTSNSDKHPDTPFPATDAQSTGDWDNGTGADIDGPYLNKPDEGVTYNQLAVTTNNYIPYISTWQKSDFDTENFFSPNRILPSPGMFGSLPTGVKRNLHWQTLLFRRQPGHPNYTAAAGSFTNDPDYLWLDLFWMPVVEPYAISEPLSTAGKINLNQQIIPFTWIERNTGMHAVLKNEKVSSIPNVEISKYKSTSTENFRRPVNIDATLSQLKFRFDNTDGTGLFAFRSAAEICDMHIVPDDASVSTADKASLDSAMKTYWESHSLTGDNSRERIYTTIYPRLTTKSNTFTVHFRAQSLKQVPGSTAGQWVEGKDLITADYRGSTTIERFIDPKDPSMLPGLDYAADPDASPTLDSFYHWRVRSHHQFAP